MDNIFRQEQCQFVNFIGKQTFLAASLNADDKFSIELLVAITSVLFGLGFFIRYMEGRPRKWPQSSGVIVKSELVRQTVNGPKGAANEAFPDIEYEFNYQGRSFKSSHWRFGNFSIGNSMDAAPILARYSVGSPVTVFVNTRQPTKSVLEANPTALCWVAFGFGFFFSYKPSGYYCNYSIVIFHHGIRDNFFFCKRIRIISFEDEKEEEEDFFQFEIVNRKFI